MFIQVPMPVQTTPAVVAVFQAANCTLDKAFCYDVSVIEDDQPKQKKHNTRKSRAYTIIKGNYYTGSIKHTDETVPAGLTKAALLR